MADAGSSLPAPDTTSQSKKEYSATYMHPRGNLSEGK